MDAISGRVTKIRTMSNGSPRIEIELDCSLADAAALFDVGAEAALARLAAKPVQEPEPTNLQKAWSNHIEREMRPKGGPLAELAGQWCKSELFWRFLGSLGWDCKSDEDARQIVLKICGIESRAELDHDTQAELTFHLAIRKPFMQWQQDQKERQQRRAEQQSANDAVRLGW